MCISTIDNEKIQKKINFNSVLTFLNGSQLRKILLILSIMKIKLYYFELNLTTVNFLHNNKLF